MNRRFLFYLLKWLHLREVIIFLKLLFNYGCMCNHYYFGCCHPVHFVFSAGCQNCILLFLFLFILRLLFPSYSLAVVVSELILKDENKSSYRQGTTFNDFPLKKMARESLSLPLPSLSWQRQRHCKF